MPGRIVCGVDDSRGGREALLAAAALSERLGLRLIVVNVASIEPERPVSDVHELELLRQAAAERAERVLEIVAGGARAPGAERRVEVGRPAVRVAAVATEEFAELIVVGSSGRGRLSSAVLGSVSRELLSHAPCPVLVIPPGAAAVPARPPTSPTRRSIVCGVDGSETSRRAARQAARIAHSLDDRLVLTHAYRPRLFRKPAAGRSQASAQLDAAAAALPPGAEAELHLERGGTAERLRRVAAEEQAELIVLGSRARGSLPTLLSGSVASDLATSAPVPVLIVAHGGWEEVTDFAAPAPNALRTGVEDRLESARS